MEELKKRYKRILKEIGEEISDEMNIEELEKKIKEITGGGEASSDFLIWVKVDPVKIFKKIFEKRRDKKFFVQKFENLDPRCGNHERGVEITFAENANLLGRIRVIPDENYKVRLQYFLTPDHEGIFVKYTLIDEGPQMGERGKEIYKKLNEFLDKEVDYNFVKEIIDEIE